MGYWGEGECNLVDISLIKNEQRSWWMVWGLIGIVICKFGNEKLLKNLREVME